MAEALLKRIEGKSFTVHADANDKGRLYKKISPEVIAETLKKETGEGIPTEAFVIKNPVQTTGEHQIQIVLEKSKALFTLVVTKA